MTVVQMMVALWVFKLCSICSNTAGENIASSFSVTVFVQMDAAVTGIRWRYVVSFTSWALQPSGKSPWHPLAKQAIQTGKEKIPTLLRNKPHHSATQYRHCTNSYPGC